MNSGVAALGGLLFACLCVPAASALEFNAAERAAIAAHGPWPPRPPADSSNRASGNEAAIRLGERLFFDHRLGNDSNFSCASCHDPGRAFSDGRRTGQGRQSLARNTPSLFNLKGNRWYGWGGEHDSLWAQSIRPIIEPAEMASTPLQVKALLAGEPRYRDFYRAAFGGGVEAEAHETVLVNAGKALAAYQETLFSPRSPFDDFRDALLADDHDAMSRYPESAQRGLRIFIGKGRCALCHSGPKFSNGGFADIGLAQFGAGAGDAGRYGGIHRLKANPYNLLGRFNDGVAAVNAVATRQLRPEARHRGEFRVPGLRGVALTAPYMHNGSLPTLRDVVQHYTRLDQARLPGDGAGILRPLELSAAEIDDLVAFLRSLGDE